MQEKSDAAVAALADTHFDIPEPIRRLECRIAPTQQGGIYYTGPSEDLVTRPGRMWWSVPKGDTEFSTWRELHDRLSRGRARHHLQVAQTVYRSNLLNRWRRIASWVSGHGEGWALYAERLMADLGFLDDPADYLGMLDGQSMRAARVVLDIGMHCGLPAPAEVGGGEWDYDKAWEFLAAHCRDAGGIPALRAGPLPRLAGPGAVVQDRRADLAAAARGRPRQAGRRVRPQAFHRSRTGHRHRSDWTCCAVRCSARFDRARNSMLIHPWDAGASEENGPPSSAHRASGTSSPPAAIATYRSSCRPSSRCAHPTRCCCTWPAQPDLGGARGEPARVLSVAGDWAYIPSAWKAIGDEDPGLGVPTTYYAAVQFIGDRRRSSTTPRARPRSCVRNSRSPNRTAAPPTRSSTAAG